MSVLKLIHKSLSDADLRHLLGNDFKILKYSQLSEISDLDELLPKPLDFCIVLYEEMLDSGHWTALSKYNGIFEHFDSYGVRPDAELHWVNLKMRRKLNEVTPHLSNLLKSKHYIYNTVKFQSEEHKINTCGSHVAHRLYKLKNDEMPLKDYQDYMRDLKRDTQTSYDFIVAGWVKEMLN